MSNEEHDDRRVVRRSNDECRRIALNTKTYFGIGRTWPVNIRRVLQADTVLTTHGVKPLAYCAVDDRELGVIDAKTQLVRGTIVITAKKSIDSEAAFGVGRPRMTLAHELGHAVMHATDGEVDHRTTGATGTTTISAINAAESAEHQAKVFAAAFLIDDTRAAELTSPFEIAEEFLVSLSAAEICYERIQLEIKRAAAATRIQQLNRAFQAEMRDKDKEKRKIHLDALCASCRSQTLLPLGTKVGCTTCGYVGDHPEDG
jgi:hypothetical protein